VLLYDAPTGAAEALRPHHGTPAAAVQNPCQRVKSSLRSRLPRRILGADVGGQLASKNARTSRETLLLLGCISGPSEFHHRRYGIRVGACELSTTTY
jgi:hypothetical protein